MRLKTTFLSAIFAIGVFVSSATAPPGGFTSPDSIRTQILAKLEQAQIPTDTWMDEMARIHFTVDASGVVDIVEVETSDAKLRKCITKKLDATQLAIPAQRTLRDYWITVNFRVV